jgi:hypothetical protein
MKAYNSNSYEDFLKDKDEYQSQKKMKDVPMESDPGAPKEKPTDDFKENTSWAKKTIAKMKYAPTTASFSEFTKAKKEMQHGNVAGSAKDDSTKMKMEELGVEELPKHKHQEKSFDIDVRKYRPKTAKESSLKAPTK